MPKIQDYNQQTNAAGPSDQRAANIEDTGNTGQAIERLGEQVGSLQETIQKKNAQREVTDISEKLSKIRADQTNKLTQTLQSATPEQISGGTPQGAPGSKSISDTFLDDFDKQLSTVGESVSSEAGKEFFKRNSAEMRGHFQTAAFHGQAELSGAQAVASYKTTIQNNSTALMNDPSQFDNVMATHDDLIKSMVAQGLPADKAPALKEFGDMQLANGAARGLMQIDPELAKRNIEEGRFDKYLTGDDKYKLLGEAKMFISAQETEKTRQKKQDKEVAEERMNKAQDSMLTRVYSNSLTTKDILNSPDLDFAAKKDMLHVLDQHSRDKLKSDPEIFSSTLARIHAPEGDPTKITDPNEITRMSGLSLTDMTKLRNEVKKTPDGQIESTLKKSFMDLAKKQLTNSNPLTGIKDPTGDQNFQSFQSDFLNEYTMQRAKGKTANELLSPTINGKPNPDYMGSKLQAYVKTPQQVMQELSQQARNASAPPGRVMVKDKSGQTGYIAADKLDAALASGKYEKVGK